MQFRRIFGALLLTSLFSSSLLAASLDFNGYRFDAYVIKASGKQYREFVQDQKSSIKVRPNEEYSIVVRNPLPVRVGVAITIDGLNSIDGKRTTPRLAQKWMIDPKSSITINGWQTSKQTLRKFVFTQQDASFAQWREDKDGKKFTKNLGVIGVAWFWNSQELETALHPPQPEPFMEEKDDMRRRPMAEKSASAPSAAPRAEARAGTGMGRQENNYVTSVSFDANAGMFSVRNVLKIFYEFALDSEEPLPFVNEDEDEGRFAPDMYKK